MKIYLLTADDGTRLFYSEPPNNQDGPEPPARPGVRGWIDRKVRKIKVGWKHADHGLAGRVRHAWDWLVRRTPPDESMLVQLRQVGVIEIHHPAHLGVEEVRVLWAEYLASRKRRHLPWFGVNAVITPLTIVLAPLPGPNLVGYWFAYRSLRHLGALLGLRRAGGDRVEISFHPNEALDRPFRADDGTLSALPHHELSRARVSDFIRRSRSRFRTGSLRFSLAANRSSH